MKPSRLFVVVALLSVALNTSCGDDQNRAAIMTVAEDIDADNKLTISRADLAAMPNPKGAGTIVYATAGRPAVWVVVEGTAFATNSPAKMVTPAAPWPRDAAGDRWRSTNLSDSPAGELLKLVGRD